MMLKTVNPEAAAVLEDGYPPVEIGSPIKYTMREGERRGGRHDCPGFIMSQNPEDGTCNLLLIIEPEDVMEQRHVQQKSEHQIYHCWEYVVPPPVKAEIDNLYAMVEELKSAMFGEFEVPPKAMMQYLADFDIRLKKLEPKTKKG